MARRKQLVQGDRLRTFWGRGANSFERSAPQRLSLGSRACLTADGFAMFDIQNNDRGWRQVKLGRGSGEMQMPGGGFKNT